MYWQEEHNDETFRIPEDIIDLLFRIECPSLPVDHAWSLSHAIQQVLPWFGDEPHAGLHLIHCADSGNGWQRPEGEDALLQLSRRTPLILRLPKERIEDARPLLGETLEVGGQQMKVLAFKPRPLALTRFLYARYVDLGDNLEEPEFMQRAASDLAQMGISFKKILCGKSNQLATPQGPVNTRSLMLADLSYPDAVLLQERGLGRGQQMGCGIFLPQKSF